MLKQGLTLRIKFFILFSVISLIPVIIVSILLYGNANLGMSRMAEDEIKHSESLVNYYFDKKMNEALEIAEEYSEQAELIAALQNADRNGMEKLTLHTFKSLNAQNHVTIFEFEDKTGRVFYRAHNPEKYGDDKSTSGSVIQALKGNEVKGFEFGSSGLAARAFVPVKAGGNIIGIFQTGFNLDDTLLQDIKVSIDGNISLYQNDTLVITSDSAMSSLIGKPMSDASIFKKVSEGGKGIRVTSDSGDVDLYLPLKDPSGNKIQGMVRISKNLATIRELEMSSFSIAVIVLASTFILTILISIFLSIQITRPIKTATESLKKVADGDLTKNSSKIKLARDETGQMIASLYKMLDNMRELVGKMEQTGTSVSSFAQNITSSIKTMENTSERVAAAVSDAAQGAVDQSISIQSGKKMVSDIAITLRKASSRVEQLLSISGNARTASKTGENNVEIQKSKMSENRQVTLETKSTMQTLLEKSREISPIIQTIKGISEQTNLLALNAAIESARAGEQGKGFAVVADEVRKLADQSKQSVTCIGDMIKEIQEYVEKAEHGINKSEEVLMENENALYESVKAFGDISSSISAMYLEIEEFSKEIALIYKDAGNTEKSISDIAVIAEQTSAGAQEMAAIAEEEASMIRNIAADAEALSGLASELHEDIRKFRL